MCLAAPTDCHNPCFYVDWICFWQHLSNCYDGPASYCIEARGEVLVQFCRLMLDLLTLPLTLGMS
jgi:hypothetical protein